MSLTIKKDLNGNSAIEEVSKIVSEMAGIQLGPRQHSMVENRLKSRMFKLEIDSFDEYLSYLKSHRESESQALVSLLTTHHTYFFREFAHFEYLLNNSLHRLINIAKSRGDHKIRIWSAASSRGQEAYSLAMFFEFHLKQLNCGVDFEIWGTDIDPESVSFATNGVYKHEELKQSPAMYINNNWSRGKDHIKEFSKIKNHLKQKCHFETANILKCENFLRDKVFDLIFCRNVFIYFNQEQIKYCSEKMIEHLHPDGYLFLGISESLNGLGVKTNLIGPSIYEHSGRATSTPTAQVKPRYQEPQLVQDRVYDILCVDDSKAIHVLLSKILHKENGYRIKHTANNGVEALKLLQENTYDAITLDMHMPEMDGVTFLEKTQSMKRPPVVVLSSINRDDQTIAQRALQLGAVDYVEKPSLENLAQSSNEIRSKLSLAIKSQPTAQQSLPQVPFQPVSEVEKAVSKIKKKVLIVDDSKTIRQLLKNILNQDPQLQVVAEAETPLQVEDLIKKHKPDVITLDIHMPQMDGVTLLKKIHPLYNIPTVMISSISRDEGSFVLDALEAGAVDYIQKPSLHDLKDVIDQIRERVRTAASAQIRNKKTAPPQVRISGKLDQGHLIVIGASTGCTEAIKTILQRLPSEIPPIVIVQHIPPIFSAAFAERLNQIMPFDVKEARSGDEVRPNQVLIAPGGKQMAVKEINHKLVIQITDDRPVNRHKPSVDYMFESVSKLNLKKVVGLILTGMGADGARMLKKLRDSGAETIAQDQSSCVVFGMPKEAIQIQAAKYVLPIDQIANKVVSICSSPTVAKKSA